MRHCRNQLIALIENFADLSGGVERNGDLVSNYALRWTACYINRWIDPMGKKQSRRNFLAGRGLEVDLRYRRKGSAEVGENTTSRL